MSRRNLVLLIALLIPIAAKPDPERVDLLRARAARLAELIETDPAQALAVALPASEAARLATIPEAAPFVESHGYWEGRASVTREYHWDGASQSGRTRIWIEAAGQTLQLFPAEQLSLHSGDFVACQGIRLGDHIAAAITRVREVTPQMVCTPLGELKYAVLLYELPALPFSSVLSPADVNQVFFSRTGLSVARYWPENSYGKLQASGDVLGPFQLDRNPDPANWDATLLQFARAADSRVDWKKYNRVYFIARRAESYNTASFTNGCGSGQALRDRGFQGSVGALYLGGQMAPELVLENAVRAAAGNFGLGTADALAASPFALGPPGAAGSVISRGDPFSCATSGYGHLAASHKAQLGWMTKGSEYQEVEAGGTFRLTPFEDSGPGLKALRVRRAPGSDRWLWLEYRQPRGFDDQLKRVTTLVYRGALAHYEDPAVTAYQDRSLLIDFTPPLPGIPYRDPRDAVLLPGVTWSDSFGPLSLRVENASASGLDVRVAYDALCASLTPTSRSHGAGAETGSIAIAAPGGCAWSASSLADWITILSSPTGSGAATLQYALSSNRTGAARSGVIGVARQTITITQAAASVNLPPSKAVVTPEWGQGFSQTFTFTITDPDGASDIDSVLIEFLSAAGDSRACKIQAQPGTNRVSLLSDSNRWDSLTAGAAGALQNTLCGVEAAGVRITKSAKDLTLTLPLVFTAHFSGPLRSQVSATDTTKSSAGFFAGFWTVPEGACSVVLSTAGAEPAAAGATGTVNIAADAGCPWLAASDVPWVAVTSSARGDGSGAVSYRVDRHTGAAPRVGALTIAGQKFSVRQAGAGGTRPMIAENGVVNGASFSGPIASSTWVTIQGANLAQTTRLWQGSDFAGDRLPVQLDGVGVNINGLPAYIHYISPTQVNALAPDDAATGEVRIEVVTPQGRSETVTASKQVYSPAFFLFEPSGRKYVAAVHPDGAYVGKTTLFPGASLRPAKPGDTILLFGTGFGMTSPAAPAAELVTRPSPLNSGVLVRIGNVAARVAFAGLVSSGLYQINVIVPEVPDGDQPIVAEIGGARTQYNAYLTVQR